MPIVSASAIMHVVAAEFDPYRKWLGVPAGARPPDHYRLLGIALFEPDADVIANAADRQIAHVRTFLVEKRLPSSTGEKSPAPTPTSPQAALARRLLAELAAARVTLLDPQKRAVYDAKLRATKPRPVVAPNPTPRPVVAANTTSRPAVAPNTTSRPVVAANTTSRPAVAPNTTSRPVVAPGTKPRPAVAPRIAPVGRGVRRATGTALAVLLALGLGWLIFHRGAGPNVVGPSGSGQIAIQAGTSASAAIRHGPPASGGTVEKPKTIGVAGRPTVAASPRDQRSRRCGKIAGNWAEAAGSAATDAGKEVAGKENRKAAA